MSQIVKSSLSQAYHTSKILINPRLVQAVVTHANDVVFVMGAHAEGVTALVGSAWGLNAVEHRVEYKTCYDAQRVFDDFKEKYDFFQL